MNLSQFNTGSAKRVLLKDGEVKIIFNMTANPQPVCERSWRRRSALLLFAHAKRAS